MHLNKKPTFIKFLLAFIRKMNQTYVRSTRLYQALFYPKSMAIATFRPLINAIELL
jgi:hypothetical protein